MRFLSSKPHVEVPFTLHTTPGLSLGLDISWNPASRCDATLPLRCAERGRGGRRVGGSAFVSSNHESRDVVGSPQGFENPVFQD